MARTPKGNLHGSRVGASSSRRAPAPTKPRIPKQAPPITDCRKCSKIAAARREATTWRREAEQLKADDQARVASALAGNCVPITEERAGELLLAAAGRDFAAAVDQPGLTLRASFATHSEKLRAAEMLKGWVLGSDKQRLEHTVKLEFDADAATDEELDVLARAREIIARLTRKDAA